MDRNHKLLNWCLRHDWGQDAHLGRDAFTGTILIRGLVERYTQSGVLVEEPIALPADYSVIRAWAGY